MCGVDCWVKAMFFHFYSKPFAIRKRTNIYQIPRLYCGLLRRGHRRDCFAIHHLTNIMSSNLLRLGCKLARVVQLRTCYKLSSSTNSIKGNDAPGARRLIGIKEGCLMALLLEFLRPDSWIRMQESNATTQSASGRSHTCWPKTPSSGMGFDSPQRT